MRIASLLVLAGALAAAAPAFAEDPKLALAVGERAPNVELKLLDGSRRLLSDLAGEKATVVYFMATW